MRKALKNLFLILAVIAITAAFSGCGRKSGDVAENSDKSPPSTSSGQALPPFEKGGEGDTATSTNAGDTATSTDEIDTSDWKVYRNEEYGFEISYPSEYEENKIYSIWETNPEEERIYNKKYWRIVKHRESHPETIIAVEVNLKNKKEEIFKDRGYKLIGEKVFIANNTEAKKVDGYETQIFIERDKFIYFISSFVTPEMKKIDSIYKTEYDEYQSILNTLKIF